MTTCSLGSVVGSGSYGIVYETPNSNTVTKIYQKGPHVTEIDSTNEIDILFRIRSPHLVAGTRIFRRGECGPGQKFGIEMERLVGRGTVLAHSNLPFEKLRALMEDYALGLQCLHMNGYLHLDLSSGNCLYGGSPEQPVGKLIDFGLSAATEIDANGELQPITAPSARVTAAYRPLENLNGSLVYSDRSDVWSLGMLYLEFLSRLPPVDYRRADASRRLNGHLDYDATALAQITELMSGEVEAKLTARLAPIPATWRSQAVSLLLRMLDLEVSSRCTITEALHHPFFRHQTPSRSLHCGYVQPSPQASRPFTMEKYQGLLRLFDAAKTDWPNFPIPMLFNAIDMYMRVVSNIASTTTENQYHQVAITCLLIAQRFYYPLIYLPAKFADPAFWTYEDILLSYLKGQLRRDYIYKQCQSDHEVYHFFYQLFVTPLMNPANLEVLTNYLQLDVDMYLVAIRAILAVQPYPTPPRGPYRRIASLMEAVGYRTAAEIQAPKAVDASQFRIANANYAQLYTSLTTVHQHANMNLLFRTLDFYLFLADDLLHQRYAVVPASFSPREHASFEYLQLIAMLLSTRQLLNRPFGLDNMSPEAEQRIVGWAEEIWSELSTFEDLLLNAYSTIADLDELRQVFQNYYSAQREGLYSIITHYEEVSEMMRKCCTSSTERATHPGFSIAEFLLLPGSD